MAQIFVAVLDATSSTFAKASWTRRCPTGIDADVRAFEVIAGVPYLSCRTTPRTPSSRPASTSLSQSDLCRDGGPLWNPPSCSPAEEAARQGEGRAGRADRRARAARPAEARTFDSLADVDAALGELMTSSTKNRPLRRLGVTRRQLLEEVDRPALKALPSEP